MDSSYGDRVADRYDGQHGFLGSDSPPVKLLAEPAAPGNRALELGVGTGRVGPSWRASVRVKREAG